MMEQGKSISRRDTMKQIAGIFGAAVAFGLLGKGLGGNRAFAQEAPEPDSTLDAGDLGSCDKNTIHTAVPTDPKHALVVSREDVLAGTIKSYNIQGRSSHNHVVVLTPEHFELLKSGQPVQVKSSSTWFHSHLCDVTCA